MKLPLTAILIVFDLLVLEGESLVGLPLRERRRRLEAFARKHLEGNAAILLSPATTDGAVAREWFPPRAARSTASWPSAWTWRTAPATARGYLLRKLFPLIEPPGFTGAAPGGPSRWSTERSAEWQPLAPKLVAEVRYDHFTGGRFRHGTRFLRWRPDKAPRQCTVAQVEGPSGASPLGLL